MATPIFPTLLEAVPEVKNFGHSSLIDPVHKVRFCSGTPLTRTVYTNIPVRYSVFYEVMENSDKQTLETWERDEIEYGGIQFTWTNPENSKAYTTVLLAPILYKIHPQSGGNIWQVSFNVAALYIPTVLFGSGLFGENLFGAE